MTSKWRHVLPIRLKIGVPRDSHLHEYSIKYETDWFSPKHWAWTWLSNCYIGFWIFDLKNCKKHDMFSLFSPKESLNFSKTWIYVKESLPMNMCTKFQVDILKKASFYRFECQKAHFLRHLWWYRHLSYFQFLSILSRFRRVLGLFFVFLRKSELKTCITPPKPKILSFNIWPRDIGWPWFDTMRIQRLRRLRHTLTERNALHEKRIRVGQS